MINAKIKICFVEENKFEDRITIDEIVSEDILQVFVDLGEMKINPMQLKLSVSLTDWNFCLSNQSTKLMEEISNIAN